MGGARDHRLSWLRAMILSLETDRLYVRPFMPSDLAEASRIFGEQDDAGAVRERVEWLQWCALSYRWLDRLKQPPFGDYAIVERETGNVVGACGYVPTIAPFAQLDFPSGGWSTSTRNMVEVGLYYHVDPLRRRRGYATEATRELIRYAREQLRLARIVATTTYDNRESMGVMVNVGMRIGRNRLPAPEWLQIVGVTNFE